MCFSGADNFYAQGLMGRQCHEGDQRRACVWPLIGDAELNEWRKACMVCVQKYSPLSLVAFHSQIKITAVTNENVNILPPP